MAVGSAGDLLGNQDGRYTDGWPLPRRLLQEQLRAVRLRDRCDELQVTRGAFHRDPQAGEVGHQPNRQSPPIQPASGHQKTLTKKHGSCLIYPPSNIIHEL